MAAGHSVQRSIAGNENRGIRGSSDVLATTTSAGGTKSQSRAMVMGEGRWGKVCVMSQLGMREPDRDIDEVEVDA